MRLIENQAIAVVVDIQDRLFPFIHGHDELLQRAAILIKGLQVLEIPLLLTEQYPKGLGHTVPALSSLMPGAEVIEKLAFSCCDEPRFDEALALSGRRQVIVLGIETHVCILQTVVDLIERGYSPVVVEDAVSSRNPGDKAAALRRMASEGALVTTTESLMFELLRFSGTPRFKAISALVK